jgi:deoxyadenosine/deoxycytidine kinase
MIIAIAGNIGSGKTTLAQLLSKHLGFQAHFEEPETNPYIQDFYNDMQRWAFHLQIYFLNHRLKHILNFQKKQLNVILDRTLYEDAEIFAHNLHNMNLLSTRDYENYLELYNLIIELVPPPDLVIYLKASISTLVEQIQQRSRPYEENIRIDYLKKLNDRYNEWFHGYNKGKKLEINIDELKFRDNQEHFSILLNKINSTLFGLFG